jgi:hypothetical protein
VGSALYWNSLAWLSKTFNQLSVGGLWQQLVSRPFRDQLSVLVRQSKIYSSLLMVKAHQSVDMFTFGNIKQTRPPPVVFYDMLQAEILRRQRRCRGRK